MRRERTNIKFPIWRKKVDSSLFQHGAITIPVWTCKIWDLKTSFPETMGKRNDRSQIAIKFNKKEFTGHITCTSRTNASTNVYRLWISDDLRYELSEVFLMSFMRDIENRLRENQSSNDKNMAKEAKSADVEKEIPFWEFLDIEFDSESRTVHMTAHYTQVPTFPELFKSLIRSPTLKRIDDETNERNTNRIHKQDWRHREQFHTELEEQNVIYMLMDTDAELLYIGETTSLRRRLRNGHKSIKRWNYYRYDVLPTALSKYRVPLERMIIRAFATILDNKRGIKTKKISSYKLANDKIDT